MSLSISEKKIFIQIIQQLLDTKQLYDMSNYIQHGNTTTFTHSLMVAYYSYELALYLPFDYDIASIVRGAMLHDFYLYDWHVPDKSHRFHGLIHADFALRNARRHFKLNQIEEDIILKHMWPLTFRKIPRYKEAFLVNFIDKICSLGETLYIPIITNKYHNLMKLLHTDALQMKSFLETQH